MSKYNNPEKIRRSLLARTPEEKEVWRKKVREKWALKTKEEKKDIAKKRINTIKVKYGDKDQFSLKNNMLKTYGVDNVSKTGLWKEKVKNTWNNRTIEENKSKWEKTKKALIKHYGTDNPLELPGAREKVISGLRKYHGWKNYDQDYPEFKKYKNRILSATNRIVKKIFSEEDLKKIGKCGVIGALQVDHRYSIKDGFLTGVSSYLISHPKNLKLIPWKENDKKKSKSEISLGELNSFKES